MDFLLDCIRRGGPVMYPILALSVLAVALLAYVAWERRAARRHPRALTVVSTIITAEPLLGILGTVTGIIRTFGALGAAGGEADTAGAMAGIGEALITTAAGLVVSLAVILPYNLLAESEDEDECGEEKA